MTNEELVKLIQDGINVKENMGLLYEQNKNFIYKLALPYSKHCEVDDLLQEGYFGLVNAVPKFNAELEYKFLTYAEHYIKLRMRRYVSSNKSVRIPEYLVTLMSKYHKYRVEYMKDHEGQEPTNMQYMKHLDITIKQLIDIRANNVKKFSSSIDATIVGTEDLAIIDTLTDDYDLELDVIDRIALEQDKKLLWNCVGELDERSCNCIEHYHKANMNQKQISEVIGVSPQRISHIIKQGYLKLKRNPKIQAISERWGYDSQQSYKYSANRFKNTNTSSTEYMAIKREEEAERQRVHQEYNQMLIDNKELLKQQLPKEMYEQIFR